MNKIVFGLLLTVLVVVIIGFEYAEARTLVKREVISANRQQPTRTSGTRKNKKVWTRPAPAMCGNRECTARENYGAVVNELNEKFKNLREKCFPRVKGCMCITGRTSEGRDITKRYRLSSDIHNCYKGGRE